MEFSELVNLASERLGSAVLYANDEFFAPKENLLKDTAPVFIEGKYTDLGKWMDGWETRRKRAPNLENLSDWCVIRLGLPGILRGLLVDTSFFRGTFPSHCSVEATAVEGQPNVKQLLGAEWVEILSRSELQGDSQNTFALEYEQRVTHLRLNIFPDGGVARLRVHGEVVPDWLRLVRRNSEFDLAAIENGGTVIASSDMFFGHRHNLIMPGSALNMSDGWETKRRRGPGYDWWLDPQKDELGAQSKNLKLNRAEARKLVQAAGFTTPIKQTYHNTPNPARDPLYEGMLGLFAEDDLFDWDINMHPDFNLYLTQIRNTGGNFDGISISFYFDHHDFDWTLYLAYHPSSTDFWMGKANEDKKMTELVLKQRRELDNKKRAEVFQEFVRYDVEKMYYIPYHFPVDFQPYFVAQPWVGGWGWWQPYIEQNPAGGGQIYSQYWHDESKRA